MIFVTAFITGLLGSFHCAGMCGPIALATPVVGNSIWAKVYSKLVYNAGRILTYAILGALLGAFGFGLKLAGMQQIVSIVAGVMIIASVITSKWIMKWNTQGFFARNASRMGKLFQRKTYPSLLYIGMLNGLLPCGFVYIGLIGSVATQQVWSGALFMMMFGLGTLPMMFTIGMAGQFLTQPIRQQINKLAPFMVVAIGCLFVLRGLNLGIPYVSPKVTQQQTEVQDCCKPTSVQ